MARSRKGSRDAGPRGTLGTLLRTTLAQAGVVREVLERGAREGRARLDDARRGRRRDQALVRLGEAVLEAVRAGDAQDLFDLPEVADALAEIDGLDAGAEDPDRGDDRGDDRGHGRAYDRADDRDDDDDDRGARRSSVWVPPGIRDRFDRFDRRPPRPPAIETDDDGTVSAMSAMPPRQPGGTSGRGAERPVRPAAPSAPAAGRARTPASEPGARFQERAPRKGGIQFSRDDDDDEDLAAYMHPDDVPPKPAGPRGDGDGDA